jgi:tetratricopeptide (TPR) repeat protein
VSGRRRLRAGMFCVAAASLSIVGGCAARRVAPSQGGAAYPEFVFPSDPRESPGVAARLAEGWQDLQRNDLHAASRAANAAVRAAPASVAARTVQGYVALAGRQQDAALRAFDASLAARAGFVPALVGRGYALLALQREPDALGAFDAALRADASLVDVKRRVDVLRFQTVEATIEAARVARAAGRLDEARLRYTRALEASPQSAFLYRELAAIERQQDRPEVAIGDLRRAAALEPSDIDGLTALGALLAVHGDLREADQVYRQAFALEPSDAIGAEMARVAARLRDAALPGEFREIETRPQVSRGDLAALLGVRFESLLRTIPAAQLVITDLRDDWARVWITTVAGTGVMEPYANHTFQPSAPALRADLAAASWRLLALAAPARPALRPYLQDQPRIADVARTHPLYSAAASAVASGVMPLLEDGRFDAARGLSGAEAAAAVFRLRALLAVE